MANNSKKARPTRYPGVFRLPDGRLLAKASLRLPSGQFKQATRILPPEATEVDAVNAVAELKSQALNPIPAIPLPHPQDTSQTVEAYAKRWLSIRVGKLKPSTATTYEICIAHHILPRLGFLPCSAVTRAAVESWTVWAQDQTRADGALYSHDTLRQWWRVLCTLLKDMAADLSLVDPTTRVSPPGHPEAEPKRELRTLDEELVGRLLAAAREHTPRRYAEIACLTLGGMRPGELYGLKWDCVDLGKGQVVLRRAISKGKMTETTKTKKKRTVPLHPHLVELLTAHRRAQLEKQDQRALASGLVFPSRVGTPCTPNSLDKAFDKLMKKLDIGADIGNQVLRRSFNTNMVRAGVDRIVLRSIMGHTTEALTARYYGASEADKAGAVSRLPIDLPKA